MFIEYLANKFNVMKIGIPISDERGLDSTIFEHFGHAPYYLIVEIDEGAIKDVNVIENIYSKEHEPGLIPSFWAIKVSRY